MKFLSSEMTDIVDSVRTVSRLEDLDTVFGNEVDAVIWKRQAPPSVLSSLATAPRSAIAEGRFCVAVDEVADRISTLFCEVGGLGSETRRWLAGDVEHLARQFAQILTVSRVLLRLEWVRDNACKRFHRDMVNARLICTYRGPGTEFGVAEEGEQPSDIHAVPTGCAVLFKGKLWPGLPGRSVLHRSPQIEEMSVSRLVVVINEVL